MNELPGTPSGHETVATIALAKYLEENKRILLFLLGYMQSNMYLIDNKNNLIEYLKEVSHELLSKRDRRENMFVAIFDSKLVTEMLFCRLVDGFLMYLSDILALVYRTTPHTLKSFNETYFIHDVLSHPTMDDFIVRLARDRVESVARRGFKTLGIHLSELKVATEKTSGLKKMEQYIGMRNQIAHERGIRKSIFQATRNDDDRCYRITNGLRYF